MPSGSIVFVWVELTADIIKIYEILYTVNRLMITIQTSEAVVRTLEDKNGFVVNDTKTAATLCTNAPNEVKAWTTEIKCAKLNYWKQKKEQNRPNSPISAPQPSRMDFLFRTGASSKNATIAGPTLEETTPMAARTGYLLKIEKDKKTWHRVWTAINNGSIWCYKTEIVSNNNLQMDVSIVVLQNSMVLFRTDDWFNLKVHYFLEVCC